MPSTTTKEHLSQYHCRPAATIGHARCIAPPPTLILQATKVILPSITLSLSARLLPEGMSVEEAAAAVTPVESAGELFPAPQPWRYVSEEEAHGCNVLELSVSGRPAGRLGGKGGGGGGRGGGGGGEKGSDVLGLRMPDTKQAGCE